MPKSDRYQYKFIEISVGAKYFNYPVDRSLWHKHETNEEIEELLKQAAAIVWEIAKTKLTKHQFAVLEMAMNGIPQQAIADKLGISQSAICKSINGNIVYKTAKGRQYYGGSIKKLKRLLKENKELNGIWEKINKLKELENKSEDTNETKTQTRDT